MAEPLQSPYSKVNIVDAEGNLVNLGGGSGDSGTTIGGATAANQVTQTQVLQNIDADLGTDITGAVMPAGGAGVRGWLSAIYNFLSSRLPALVSGRVPVDVASLSVTVNNAQLEIANDAGNPIPVDGSVSVSNFPATQPVSGAVSISNFPVTQPVSGAVSISNFPVTQPVSGTIAFSNTSIGVSSLPALPAGNNAIGSVSISNFPATQPISGAVSISNFPATQPISGTVAISNSSIEIANDVGSPIPVNGSVNIGNFPTTQVVSGTVAISNSSIEIANDVGSPISIGGVYNVTSPTLTNGQGSNIQLSVRGNVLIDCVDYVSSPTNIQAVDTNSTTSIGQDNQVIIRGNPSNNSFASYASSGNSSFAILIENQPAATPFVGTLQIERSLDGNIWTSIGAFVAGSRFVRSQITAEAVLHGNCSSSQFLRVRAIAWTSGIARVTFLAGQGTGTTTVGNPLRIFDQVSGAELTIKAANVSATSADPAVVVTSRDKPSTINTNIPNSFPVSSTASVIALNNDRKGLTISNPLAFDIFVGFQSTVSSTSYAVKIPPSDSYGYWEAPYNYVGIISIATATGNSGNIFVRELI
ncbi:MAG: hypothetical protein KME29_04810 [Calothrix sp. FI2-JRJ7]|jgi:hypothetical protein|nr:hypothetical protein [Calothrix sp. FI2-JRJ7]